MSAEVDWVLDQLASVVSNQPADHPLKRVDRDDSEILEDSIRSRKGELQAANYVGATLADRVPEPVGSDYDHRLETVVGLRIEGLHADAYGHIDPDGVDGVQWTDGLVAEIRDALLAERHYPAAGPTGVTYTDLQFQNEAPDSAQHRDFYRHDIDIVFHGFEDLQ